MPRSEVSIIVAASDWRFEHINYLTTIVRWHWLRYCQDGTGAGNAIVPSMGIRFSIPQGVRRGVSFGPFHDCTDSTAKCGLACRWMAGDCAVITKLQLKQPAVYTGPISFNHLQSLPYKLNLRCMAELHN